MKTLRPRRSVLFMPGSNDRALEKAKTLSADTLIFDLEDAVAMDAKAMARHQVAAAIEAGGYGKREVVVRVNSIESGFGKDDLKAIAATPVDGVVLPKVESVEQVQKAYEILAVYGANDDIAIWVQAETPRGVLNIDAICAHPRVRVVMMGTSDLSKDLRVPHTTDRIGFIYALSHCVLVARAHGLDVIDGVQLNLDDLEVFEKVCQQGRDLGFDGKSLIHPKQLEICNRIFSPSAKAIEHAKAIIAAWSQAESEGKGICVVDGKLIESLHIEEANRLLILAERIAELEQG